MKRTITAALFALFVLVTAQTAAAQQQTSPEPQQTTTNNTTTTDTTATTDPVTIDPAEEEATTIDSTSTTTAAMPRTGEKATKLVTNSCPVHPEVKTRTAGKCPLCRREERKQTAARAKEQGKPTAQHTTTTTIEPQVSPTEETVMSEPTAEEPATREPSTQPVP